MRGFEYANPTTKEQAVGLLGNDWADADVLAGGTDLLALMKDDIVAPKRLVNIKDIQELRGITVSSKGLRIGALVTIQELADDAHVREAFPVVAMTAIEIAGPQIRNMGTVGGIFASVHGVGITGPDLGFWQKTRVASRWCPWVTIATTQSSAMQGPPISSALQRLPRCSLLWEAQCASSDRRESARSLLTSSSSFHKRRANGSTT